ncbi:RebB family R body protein [Sneathiella glossodoripedis]|uniref:RebB family R body protein n=1 Tax=Sneathiella glossodoripedis TaxID=418853 RepID=UPI000471D184|nr:RebB family R body protein [Sneathiella glossodoripedis]
MAKSPQNKNRNSVLDSVVAVNEIVLGSAASTAMAAMYISMAQATGVSNQNTVSTQHQRNILGTAAIAAGTGNLLWSGLTQQVADMPLNARMKNWEDMLAIAEGRETGTDVANSEGASSEKQEAAQSDNNQ